MPGCNLALVMGMSLFQGGTHVSSTTRILGIAASLLAFLAPSATASTIDLFSDSANSTSSLGRFTGSISYDDAAGSDGVGTLSVHLQNSTMPSYLGGYLTAFAMNIPTSGGSSVTGVSLTSAPANFGLIGGPSFNNGINGAPFGRFDFGASTSSSYLGGGNPNTGLGVGQSGTFVFSLTGSGLNSLDVWDFVNAFSFGPPAGHGPEFFLARFRGFSQGGSDKVPGDPGKRREVPEPTALLLLGAGLLGVARARRRA